MNDQACSTIKKEPAPLEIIYQDTDVLVVQTLAYAEDSKVSKQVLAEEMLAEGQESYGRFNVGLHVADQPTQVLHNRCQLLDQLNRLAVQSEKPIQLQKKVKQIHWLNQIHGNHVLDVDTLLSSNQSKVKPQDADALTSTTQGQALAIMTADCVPIMLYCPESGRIAGAHAGWHGLKNGVIAKTVKAFNKDSKNNIKAWIGACISLNNYEVNAEVVDKLTAGTLVNFSNFNDSLELAKQITKVHNNTDKAWINLPLLAKLQLQSLDIEVLTQAVPCSYADSRYYSHRRATHKNQGNTGRMAMLIVKV